MTYEEIVSLETEFSSNNYNGLTGDYVIIPGNSVVMFSAPHAVKHVRHGKLLSADCLTGAMVKILHQKLNTSVIYKTKNNNDDVNFDVDTNYESELVNYIIESNVKCLIDIHVASSERDFDFEVGDGDGASIKTSEYLYPIIKACITKAGFILDHNVLFKASGNGTVTSEISAKTKIPCFQIEINRRNISLDDIDTFNKTIEMLITMVRNLQLVL